VKVQKNKLPAKSEESLSSSSDEEEKHKTKSTRAAREHQVTQVTDSGTGLHFITLPIQETKKGRISFLLDTGATLTLIKVGHLKGGTLIREKQLAFTGVTGHKIHTLGKIKAT